MWSKLKPADKFALMWSEYGYGTPNDCVREYEFLTDRKHRFDFAWPQYKVAVEIHGFGFGHQAQQRLADNCVKERLALLAGWLVVPFTTRCIASRSNCLAGVEQVCLLLERRADGISI